MRLSDQHDPKLRRDGREKGASDLPDSKSLAHAATALCFALITLLLSHFYNAIPTDLSVVLFHVCYGAIFGEIGKRLPIFQ